MVTVTEDRKAKICALLKSIETGDPAPIAVVNQDKYIQHNPQTHEGCEGLDHPRRPCPSCGGPGPVCVHALVVPVPVPAPTFVLAPTPATQ